MAQRLLVVALTLCVGLVIASFIDTPSLAGIIGVLCVSGVFAIVIAEDFPKRR
jgi:uncharacterized membrane protein YgaE (UPF0421/DUF939 family)